MTTQQSITTNPQDHLPLPRLERVYGWRGRDFVVDSNSLRWISPDDLGQPDANRP